MHNAQEIRKYIIKELREWVFDFIEGKRERKRKNVDACTYEREKERERERIREKKESFLIAIGRDSIVTPLIVICAYKASEIKEI